MTPTPPDAAVKKCNNFSPPEWTGPWRDWHRGHGCHLDPFCAPTKHWSVSVERNGENVVTLAANSLSGRYVSAEDADTVRSAARHLMAFIGEPATPPAADAAPLRTLREFDFIAHLQRQREFSERTFGPGMRTTGVVDHIRKELREIEADPTDASEWADVVILGLDGFWRAGYTPEQIVATLVAKQTKNEGRTWPDWRTAPLDKAIEHDRTKETH